MKQIRYILLIVAAIAMVCSCRSTKDVTDGPKDAKSDECQCGSRWIEGSFDSEVAGVAVSGALRMACDSVVWVSLSKVVEVGRLRLTPDSVVIHIKILNSYFRGTYNDVYRLTGYRTTFNEVQQRIIDAYLGGGREVVYDVDARQLKQRIVLHMRRLQASPTPLRYPIKIPATAKPFK